MCLDTVKETGLNKSGAGWKAVFENGIEEACFTHRTINGGSRGMFEYPVIPVGKWIKATVVEIKMKDGSYQSGFHIFKSALGAGKFIKRISSRSNTRVIPVRYRGGHTKGSQGGYAVIVAKEMYVPND